MARIGFASWEFHPATQGGCGVFLYHATQHLLKLGHEVFLLLDMLPEEFQEVQQKILPTFARSEHCHAFHVEKLSAGFPYSATEIPNVYQHRSLRFAHALKNLILRHPLDSIEFFEYCGAAYYTLARKLYEGQHYPPISIRMHAAIEIVDSYQSTRPINRELYEMHGLERASMSFAESILSPSKSFFEAYYRDAYAIDPMKVIYTGMPADYLPGHKDRSPFSRTKITFLGRVNPFKGVEQLIQAAMLLIQANPNDPIQFDFLGSDSSDVTPTGSYIADLKKMIPSPFRDRFVFHGHIPHDQLPQMLSDAAFAVFPNRFESFCYALHEIHAFGLPVIINDLPAFREFFEDGKNCLTYNGTASDLLRVMLKLINNPNLRDRLSSSHSGHSKFSVENYENLKVLAPLKHNSPKSITSLVIILESRDKLQKALDSILQQSVQPTRIIVARPALSDSEESCAFLGRRVIFVDPAGDVIPSLEIKTQQSILLLKDTDVLHRDFFKTCIFALASRPSLSFAGTWARCNNRIQRDTLDIAPEAYPMWYGDTLTRALIRTVEGDLLIDLFDSFLGTLGEIGYLWKAIDQWGPGSLYPEPMIDSSKPQLTSVSPGQLTYLMNNYGKSLSLRKQSLGILLQQEYLSKLSLLDPKQEYSQSSLKEKFFEAPYEKDIKRRIAESLGGVELLRIAASRWFTRKKRS